MKILTFSLGVLLFSSATSFAANIVGLAPSDPSNLLNSASGGVATVTVVGSTLVDGLTMNITFTPSAIDIGQATNAVNLIEIGGNANGTGLFLLGGQLHFLSKMQGAAANVVTTFDDLDYGSGNNMVGVISSFGALTAGTEYSVGVIYDPLGASSSVTFGVLPTGGSLFQESVTLTGQGTKTNWQGNRTVNAFTSPGNVGAGTSTAGQAFQEGAAMNALDGTAGQAALWNTQGTLVPEPSTSGVLGLAGLLMMARRRR